MADIARDAGVGGTVPYAYFPGKEALFLAAIDEDAAGLIEKVVPEALGGDPRDWPQRLVATALAEVDGHPLARRVLAGLEPEVTARVLGIPALEQLRKGLAAGLAADQAGGRVRDDIDAHSTASGIVAIMLALLMAVLQVGSEVALAYGDDVSSVLRASLEYPLRADPADGD